MHKSAFIKAVSHKLIKIKINFLEELTKLTRKMMQGKANTTPKKSSDGDVGTNRLSSSSVGWMEVI